MPQKDERVFINSGLVAYAQVEAHLGLDVFKVKFTYGRKTTHKQVLLKDLRPLK